MDKKSKRKKLKLGGLFVIILALYLLVSCGYYMWNTPIKNVEITGNYYLKDNYLISYLDLDNTSILKVSRSKIKKKLLKLDLISSVKVHKNYLGKLKIEIKEDKILFYNWNNKKIITSSGKEIEYNEAYLGIPTLINYVPSDIYDEFVEKLNKIDKEKIALISEIEYSPSIVNDKTVDEKRFLFRMNDGNIVYINTINIEKFNNYLEIYEVIENKNGNQKGCLYLDSAGENNHFDNCEPITSEGENDGEDKLST